MREIYTSCSCNCQPRIIDWARDGLICYGYANSIALYDPQFHGTGKVIRTFHKHPGPVKVVQWLENGEDCQTKILSGSLDGTIIIWSRTSSSNFEPRITLSLGEDLTTTRGSYLPGSGGDQSLLVCASSFKEIFTIWRLDGSECSILETQKLDLKKRIPTEALLTVLPGSSIPMIIIVMDDTTIQMFAWNSAESPLMNFVHVKELKGHQDWIQSLDYARFSEREAMLATGSQDGTIRLWKLSVIDENVDLDERVNLLSIGTLRLNVSLESVLSGHDHWVYGVHWHPSESKNEYNRPQKLLSCALDTTMIIWQPSASGVWTESVRLGKVGGTSVGYYGCKFNTDGSSVLAHGYQGTVHMWQHDQEENKWLPRSVPSGHFSDVNDLHWEPSGRYLITTSSDQTTRVHVPWCKDGESEIWHEIARPQIHGYDINCLAVLSATTFASGADEKVVRVFAAPAAFVEALESGQWKISRKSSTRTSIPVLGLTNKAMDDKLTGEIGGDGGLERPPTEEEIIRDTVWPEQRKLYGHGYEIFSMCASTSGKVLATACKSNSAVHSAIILWSTETWTQIQTLVAHRLTVTQLAFSPDDQYLISVSRDRRWALYRKCEGDETYDLACMSPTENPLHTRIIWCCAWTHDSKYFATGSRDGKVGVWSVVTSSESREIKLVLQIEIKNASVTALNFVPSVLAPDTYALALGFDEGEIEIRKLVLRDEDSASSLCLKLDTSVTHHKIVKRLAFRPGRKLDSHQLASCSADKSVKIYQLNLQEILSLE